MRLRIYNHRSVVRACTPHGETFLLDNKILHSILSFLWFYSVINHLLQQTLQIKGHSMFCATNYHFLCTTIRPRAERSRVVIRTNPNIRYWSRSSYSKLIIALKQATTNAIQRRYAYQTQKRILVDQQQHHRRLNSAAVENGVMFCVLQDHMGTKNQHGNASQLADTRSHYCQQCYITATATPDNTSLRRTQPQRLTKPASLLFQSWGIPHNHARLCSCTIDSDVLNISQASENSTDTSPGEGKQMEKYY
jgi:hypothetical protein